MVLRNIILVGMMGSGKTTIGKLLATHLGLNFVDTDEELENRAGRPIHEIFATDGEPFFRQRETEVLSDLCCGTRQVIATGGGVVLKEENIRLLRAAGVVIFLKASPEELAMRLNRQTSQNSEEASPQPIRPLLAGGDLYEKLQGILDQRLSLYCAAADLEIETTGISSENVVQCLISELVHRQESGK